MAGLACHVSGGTIEGKRSRQKRLSFYAATTAKEGTEKRARTGKNPSRNV